MPSSFDAYLPAVRPAALPDVPKTEFYRGTSTTWGEAIAVSCGVRRLPSYKIWLESYRTVTIGEGTYASFAVSFGAPLDPDATGRCVKAIWADGRLVWSSHVGAISGNDNAINWRFYPGSETQRQDPLMVADNGAELTPAYRGQMIMVLEDFPLKYFNDHVPSISAEIWDGVRLDNSRAPVDEQIMLFAEQSGVFTAQDIDAAAEVAEETNDGVYVATNVTFQELLNVYAKFYDFDYCESQGTIKIFRAVNDGVYEIAATLTESDFLAGGAGSAGSGGDSSAILTTRYDKTQAPITQTINYRDRTQQFQFNVQRARRQQFPQPSVQNGGADEFTIPIIVTASEAMTAATKALYRAAHERTQHGFQLPPNYLYLEPGDVVLINIAGRSYLSKLNKVEVQGDLSIKCNAVNLARGPDYARQGFAGGVQNYVIVASIRVGDLVNRQTFYGQTLAETP
jgi:hypothetical protein